MLHNLLWHPGMTLQDAENVVIQEALRFCKGNKQMTCQMLQIAQSTLDRRLDCINGKKPEDYGIEEKRVNRKLKKNEDKAS